MNQIWQTSLIGLIGLCFGSFFNVLIWRLNNENVPKFWQGRSLCPKCRHVLSWVDNIPLLSFLLLRGKCRHCEKPISWQYPVVELTTALIFVLLVQFGKFGFVNAGIASAFVIIFFSDLIYGLIPDEMIAVGIVFVIASIAKQSSFVPEQIAASLTLLAMTGVLTTLPFFVLARFKKMGYGDVTLAFLMGFVLGFPKIVVALWSGFIIGGVFAVILLLLKKTKLSATIPLGPFLILGVVIAILWSDKLLKIIGFG